MIARSKPPGLRCVLVALVVFVPGVGTAAEWYLDPAVDTRFEYDDNFRLRNEELEVAGMRVEPRFESGVNTERWKIDLDTRFDFRRYDEEQFNTDNQSVSLSSAWGRQTWGLALDAAYIRDATTSSELDTTGQVEDQATRRRQSSVRPTFTWQLGERDQVALGASVSVTRYDSANFNDYDYNALDITWSHTLGAQTSLQVAPYFTRFESSFFIPVSDFEPPAEDERQSDTLGVNVGLTRAYSERLRIDATLGGSRVETSTPRQVGCLEPVFVFCQRYEIADAEEDNSGFVGQLGAEYTGELWKLDGSVSRSYTPSGNGFLIVKDQLEGNADYSFNEHLRALLRVTFSSSESVETELGFSRDFLRIAVGLRYRLTQRLSIVGLLSHRNQERQSASATTGALGPVVDADANAMYIEFRYNFDRHRWSR